jgi:glycosyltransferase involved in cell wall biosynthesis
MKIAYLMQEGVPDIRLRPLSGPANHPVRIIEELKNHGHQVRLIAVRDRQIWVSDDLINYRKVTVRWLGHGLFGVLESILRRVQFELHLPYFALFDSLRFSLACKQELEDFDLFYERMGWMGYGGGLAARMMNIPLIFEVNGDHLSELRNLGMEPHGMQRMISIFLMKKAIHRASHSIATGNGWKQIYMERWGINSTQVSVIENGTEMVHLLQKDQLKCFRCPDSPSESVKLVYVGAFEPWQGLPVLLNSISKVIAHGMPISLVMIGTGSLLNEIKTLIQELKIEPFVNLPGQLPMEQVAKILASADIGVSSYCGRVEFSGLKLLDYKAAGLATIASGENGQPTVITQGQTGIIVSPCNEDELTEAICQLSTNGELRKQMGQKARMEAEEFHTWSQTVLELEKVFHQVLSK